MTFTRRIYRVAIARSIRREDQLRVERLYREPLTAGWRRRNAELRACINHTARLQRRKRRERK